MGEIVELIPAPSPFTTVLSQHNQYYYGDIISLQTLINNNILKTASDLSHPLSNSNIDFQETQTGNNKDKKSPSFDENQNIYPLQHYEGDYLLEGRFGQSIRLGRTVDKNINEYSAAPTWKRGIGKNGDPIIIIRNGQKLLSNTSTLPIRKSGGTINRFITEDINYDDSSIYFTSNQEILLKRASEQDKSLKNEKLFSDKKFDGKQIIFASDRIVLNSRKKETLIFSGGGIGLSSIKSITLDSAATISLASKLIELGVNSKKQGEPAVLGNSLEKRMLEVLDVLDTVVQGMIAHTHPTGVGPSGPPIPGTDVGIAKEVPPRVEVVNIPQPGAWGGALGAIAKIKKKIVDIKSEYVYLKRKPDYTSEIKVSPAPKNR